MSTGHVVDSQLLNIVIFSLLTRMVYAELCDTLYNATLASLFGTVEFSSATGLTIRARGYNDKLQSLFMSVVDAICDFRIIEDRVEDCIHEVLFSTLLRCNVIKTLHIATRRLKVSTLYGN